MIEIQSIAKTFSKLRALDGISAAFEKGQSVALIGPNGSGKTTLIKTLLGMVVPDGGGILFGGQPIAGSHDYRRRIGYMPQIGRYPDHMKIGQLFEMLRDLRATETDVDEELIEAFRLREMFHKPMRTLSGGTRQKVSAAAAFLFRPPVLILDEPTAGLDPLAAEILKSKVLRERDNARLFLITSHILSDLDELSTHIMYLMDGQMLFFKSLDALKTETGEAKLGRAIAQVLQQNEAQKIEQNAPLFEADTRRRPFTFHPQPSTAPC